MELSGPSAPVGIGDKFARPTDPIEAIAWRIDDRAMLFPNTPGGASRADSVKGKMLRKRELEEELELLNEAVAEYEAVVAKELAELDTAVELYLSRDQEIALMEKNKREIAETFNTAMRAFSNSNSSEQGAILKGLVVKERQELLGKWQAIYNSQWCHSDHQTNLERSRTMETVQKRFEVARRCFRNLALVYKRLIHEKTTMKRRERSDLYRPLEYLNELEGTEIRREDHAVVITPEEMLQAISKRKYL